MGKQACFRLAFHSIRQMPEFKALACRADNAHRLSLCRIDTDQTSMMAVRFARFVPV